MDIKVESLSCPGCGAPVDIDDDNCPFCGRQLIITKINKINKMNDATLKNYITFYEDDLLKKENSYKLNLSFGLCYLKLNLYEKAINHLNVALEKNIENSEIYYYLAIATLQGKKAFLTPRKEIDKIINYLNIAIKIEKKGIYYYLLSYILFDHHYRKGYYVQENFKFYFDLSKLNGVTSVEVNELFTMLKVVIPKEIQL